MILNIFLTIISISNSFANIDYDDCGVANENKRIIGGNVVPDHKYPWVAFLITRVCGQYYGCGASIIDRYHLLTAAHCVHGADEVRYRVGSNYAVKFLNETLPTKCYFSHGDYTTETYQNDIAIVRLKRPLTFNQTVRAVCVPKKSMKLNENRTFEIAGWGVTENRTTASQLMETNVTYTNFDECNEYWNGMVNKRIQFCAADIGHGVCFGDSGGPVTQQYRNRYFIFGVVSYTNTPCGSTRNSVYGYVPGYDNWIRKVIDSDCREGKMDAIQMRNLNIKPNIQKLTNF